MLTINDIVIFYDFIDRACCRVKGTHPVAADAVRMESSVIPVAITVTKELQLPLLANAEFTVIIKCPRNAFILLFIFTYNL